MATAAILGILGFYFLSVTHLILRGKAHLPIMREYLGTTRFFAPINFIMYLFTRGDKSAIVKDRQKQLPTLKILEDNWEIIRDEAEALQKQNRLSFGKYEPDIGFSTFQKAGWKRFYIKWYGIYNNSALEAAPKTVALLKKMGNDLKAAAFVILPPGSRLGRHRDPYAGSMRYHLGLRVPNSENCFISVDDNKYAWMDGEGVLLDQTYVHYVENNTDKHRLILLCDVKRNVYFPANIICAIGDFMMRLAALPNNEQDSMGIAAKAFLPFLHGIRSWEEWKKKFKSNDKNKKAYYIGKRILSGAVVLGLAFLIYKFVAPLTNSLISRFQ
ncbi:MAG: aspartyl/asparaginyl beta-hydroxylase domain-containing protein [Candidatus Caenarcaniphilales bacterium]|nr:aspartyl/asparaginyl beta-hydroxylase domain-containing protein [Candidatus Caenarcaniphilales bacterium]